MRTTIDIDDDVFAAAKELARLQKVSAGQVVSRLIREALSGRRDQALAVQPEVRTVAGFRPFPARGVVVTNEQINALRDQEGA